MNNILGHFKAVVLLFLFFIVLTGSIIILYFRLLFTPKTKHQDIKFLARRQFCKRANQIFGVRMIIMGKLPLENCHLYISNHRSFYDPVAFLSQLVANPVSKAEVSRYPIIGWGTRLTEVLMLDRTKKAERRRMKQQIYECLLNGTSILVYPEGTTSGAHLTNEFKKGAFESAVRAERAVVPVAMEYPDESYYWIGKGLYQQFLHQMVRPHDPHIYLSIGTPVWDPDPMKLMEMTRASIDEMIKELRRLRDRHKG